MNSFTGESFADEAVAAAESYTDVAVGGVLTKTGENVSITIDGDVKLTAYTAADAITNDGDVRVRKRLRTETVTFKPDEVNTDLIFPYPVAASSTNNGSVWYNTKLHQFECVCNGAYRSFDTTVIPPVVAIPDVVFDRLSNTQGVWTAGQSTEIFVGAYLGANVFDDLASASWWSTTNRYLVDGTPNGAAASLSTTAGPVPGEWVSLSTTGPAFSIQTMTLLVSVNDGQIQRRPLSLNIYGSNNGLAGSWVLIHTVDPITYTGDPKISEQFVVAASAGATKYTHYTFQVTKTFADNSNGSTWINEITMHGFYA